MPLTHSKKTLVHYHIMKSGGSSINHAFYCYAYNHNLFMKTALANNLGSDIFSTLNKLTHNELNEDFNNISMKDQIGGKLPHYLERYIFAYAEQLNGITAI